ncbi:MAG: restriction endonuclease subunit S, partial [Acetobacteraceae bacterium]|nr:restriction endonuclease subunit S [Acetobacteraceae bacterium]
MWRTVDQVAATGPYAVAIGPFGSNLLRQDYRDEGVRLVFVRDIKRGSFNDPTARYVTQAKAEQLHQHVARAGDVLITKMGEPPGDTMLFPNDEPPAIITSDCIKLTPNPNIVVTEFLNLCLGSPSVRGQLENITKGVAQQKISLVNFRRIVLPMPSLAEQRRIVARIEALFARTRRARADLERIAPLSRRYRDRTLANEFDIGKPTSVAELASAVFDGPFGSNLKSDDYTDSGTRVVRLENIGHLRFIGDKRTFITDEKADGLRRHHLHPDDVLFSSFIDKEVRVCLFPSGQPTNAINKADCFCVRVDPKRADPRYVALRLASPVTYDDMRDAVHGATRPRIGITDLKQYLINAPSLAEQKSIAERVEGQHGMSNLIQREAARVLDLLDRLEQSILARAFNG